LAPAGGIRWLNGPTALEITAAQDMLARFSGFEQLTADYVVGRAAASANPDQVKAAAPGTRLAAALAAWEFRRTAPWPPTRTRLIRFA